MKAVNLLPPERRGSHRVSNVTPFLREPLLAGAVGLVVLAVGLIGYSSHSASSKVASRHEAISRLDAQIAKVKPASPTAVNDAASRLTALTTLADGRTSWDGFLGTLARVVPEDVWLMTLSAQASPASASTTAPSTTAPTGVTFTGYTYSQPSVARMMRRLELLPWLQNVSLVNSTKSAIANTTVYQFTLGASFVSLPEVGT